MFKVFLSLILLSVFLFSAQEDSYVFEAKGKFAKELKTLIEKYSKDGKVDIKVVKLSDIKENEGIISAFLSSRKSIGNVTMGKKIYKSNCFKCHGTNANESSYVNARILSKLSKEEIIDQVISYKRSPAYGGSTNFIMRNAVETLNENQIKSVAQYIINLNKQGIKKIGNNSNVKSNNESKGESGSYLQ
jgi:cytochrome c553